MLKSKDYDFVRDLRQICSKENNDVLNFNLYN